MAKSDLMLARSTARRAVGSRSSASKGYSLFSVATGAALARLRPTGNHDEVEILGWRHGRWASIGDFGGLIMPLDQALDHIASDPWFWSQA